MVRIAQPLRVRMPLRDPLDELLNRWQPPSHQIPDLHAEIRRELARRETSASDSWLDRIEQAFRRPSFAVTFVAACILLGLFLAEARVSRLHAENGARMARSYVQVIDPLIQIPATETIPARP